MTKDQDRHVNSHENEGSQKEKNNNEVEQYDFSYYVRLFKLLLMFGRLIQLISMYRDHYISEEKATELLTDIMEEL